MEFSILIVHSYLKFLEQMAVDMFISQKEESLLQVAGAATMKNRNIYQLLGSEIRGGGEVQECLVLLWFGLVPVEPINQTKINHNNWTTSFWLIVV